MSYDALVWLLVGLGIGVAVSLMLLIGYAGVEQARLGRRLRRARAMPAMVEAEPVPSPAARPVARPQPVVPAAAAVRPAPVRPVAASSVAAPKPAVAVAVPEPVVVPEPVEPVAAPAEAAPSAPKLQSVEALFAEAFANDRLTVGPEPDDIADAPKT